MKAARIFFVNVCAIALFAHAAHAGEFFLKPVSASGTHQIMPSRCVGSANHGQLCDLTADDCPDNGRCTSEIRLTGGNQRVRVEVRLADWAPHQLRAWQAQTDCGSYSNGMGGMIVPHDQFVCTSSSGCTTEFGESGAQCQTGSPRYCEAGFINRLRSDYVFFEAEELCGVNRGVGRGSCNYLYFASATPPCTALDDGTDKYGGTLILNVPSNAAGTYNVHFIEQQNTSFMADENSEPLLTTYGRMNIVMVCLDETDCEDNNACTNDSCSSGVCSNTPNYDTNAFCCNPADGNLTPLNNTQCTNNTCNLMTGAVIPGNKAAGTNCGSGANTQCDKPDSCDGMGVCNPRFEPTITLCNDLSPATTCNPADTCNGMGSCTIRLASSGTPCGDESPLDPECDLGDTCNGSGSCLTNQVANGTPCDDGEFCSDPNLNERCQGGMCQPGQPRNCADSLTCTTDVCDEINNECDHNLDSGNCLIDEDGPGGAPPVCYTDTTLNPANTCEVCDSTANSTDWTVLPDDSPCNDGNACTGTPNVAPDICTGGMCEGELDPNCNDTCDVAVVAIVGQNVSDNSSAGADDGEASCEPNSNADVWWEYTTSECGGQIFVSTTGSALAPVNDPVISVYTDCPPLGGEIACDDDSGALLNGALTFMSTPNTRYVIRVAGYGSNVGPIVMNLRPADNCFIDDQCYPDGALNPENDCQACVPEVSTTNWSNRMEGLTCDCDGPGGLDGSADTDCDSPDACDGAGMCECNFKPDNLPCTDEAPPHNECTQNLCLSGLCTHPPEPLNTPCDFPGEGEPDCDNADTCNGGGLCVENLEPIGFPCGNQMPTDPDCDFANICDGEGACLDNPAPQGTDCDDEDVCTGTDVCDGDGGCAGTSILQAPIVEAISSRHFRVTPQPPGSPAPIALYVTSPDWPCLSQYIVQSGGLVGFNDREIMLVDDWGTILVHDPDVVPDTVYEVRAECGSFMSAPGSDTTNLWGDVNSDGVVNIIDVSDIVDRIKELPTPHPDEAFDLFPCVADDWINVLDLARVVDVLHKYPFPCGLPCHD